MTAQGQFRTHALQQMALLFDNLVNDSENARWNIQVERLDGRKVDNELEFDRLQYRQVRRLLAFEDTPDIDARVAISIGQIGPVAHNSARQAKKSSRIDRR